MQHDLEKVRDEVKQISIESFLARQGIFPSSTTKKDAWYHSPLRQERTPSFKVDRQMNVWKDFGADEPGGDIIELVKRLSGVSYVEAIDILAQERGIEIVKYDPQEVLKDRQDPFNITWTGELFSDDLRRYIVSRGIPIELAMKYVQEVWFNLWSEKNQRWYSMKCLGFKNDKDGWEFRNADWKGGNSPKWFTTIKGTKDIGTVNVFEGWIDFLSALLFYDREAFEADTIVMNSLSFFGKVCDVLKDYHTVNLFLDNDNAGRKFTGLFSQQFYCRDFSGIYKGHEDFNAKLTSS